ncbi:hypothetical protein NMG60_11023363 [Bertholletia excelsa]
MAQSNLFAFFVFAVVAISFSAVSGEESVAPAAAPSMDAGSAQSLPVSGAIVCASLVLSLLAFIKY